MVFTQPRALTDRHAGALRNQSLRLGLVNPVERHSYARALYFAHALCANAIASMASLAVINFVVAPPENAPDAPIAKAP
jgi:hypothetical protein